MKSQDYINKWKDRSKVDHSSKEDYLISLKSRKDTNQVDRLSAEADHQASREINCLDCGNCCRTSVTDFNASDVKRVSKYLGISKKTLIKRYLMEDHDGTFVTITSPCPFLSLNDNTCNIYEVRPEVCASYPHTHKKNFFNRIHAHSANLYMCPITYRTVELMQQFENK